MCNIALYDFLGVLLIDEIINLTDTKTECLQPFQNWLILGMILTNDGMLERALKNATLNIY